MQWIGKHHTWKQLYVAANCLWGCLHAMDCASCCNTSLLCLSFSFCFIYLKDKYVQAEIAFHSRYVPCPAGVSFCLVELLVVIVVFNRVLMPFVLASWCFFEYVRWHCAPDWEGKLKLFSRWPILLFAHASYRKRWEMSYKIESIQSHFYCWVASLNNCQDSGSVGEQRLC